MSSRMRLCLNRSLFTSHVRINHESTIQGSKEAKDISIQRPHSGHNVVPKIGLEVHAQLKINSKLFSEGSNNHESPSNTQLDFLDIALPGSLPKVNQAAVKSSILTALGLNCTIQDTIHFDRKNYFYSDMPAGYQITQRNKPVAKGGHIDFIAAPYHKSLIAHAQQYDVVKYLYSSDRYRNEEFSPYIKRSHIEQIQLEQDSAKTLNFDDDKSKKERYCMIDYNRSGSALIEIVFQPDLTKSHEASSLIKELIRILKALGTCDCELESGSLRVDANVSIQSIDGETIENSPRVELKNLNSLRSLNRGILYEIDRQSTLILQGHEVLQESRIYLSQTDKTTPLRLKEDSVDYRYVPEPSIPPIKLSESLIGQIRKELPSSLPQTERNALVNNFNLDLIIVDELMNEPGLCDFFIELVEGRSHNDLNALADFLIYAIANLKRSSIKPVQVTLVKGSEFREIINVEMVRRLFDMMLADEISYSTAYEVMKHAYTNNDRSDPRKIVEVFGWFQITNNAEIVKICDESIKLMKNISKKYGKSGDKKYLRMMLDKICANSGNKISVKKAIQYIDCNLKPKPIESNST